MTRGKGGAMSPTLIDVKIKCPKTGIEAVIMRPAYKTEQKGLVKCPHCNEMHAYHLDYNPAHAFMHEAPRIKS